MAGDVDGYGPWHEHVLLAGEPAARDGRLSCSGTRSMLADPADNLCAAMDFLGEPVERERAEQTISEYTAERMRERERQTRFHERKQRQEQHVVRKAKAGDWAETLTPEDEELF